MPLMMPVGTVSVLDMHCHTKEGSMDGLASIFDIVRKMKNLGYTGLVVSDHNSYKGYETWINGKDQYPDIADFNVIKAIEYDSRDGGHVLIILPEGVELKPLLVRGMKITRVLEEVHRAGGICGMVHPFGPGAYAAMHTKKVMSHEDIQMQYDFVETYNAHITPMANDMAEILNEKLNKPFTAGTDAHKLKYVATAATAFSCPITNTNELIEAILNRKMLYAGKVGSIEHPQLKGVVRFATNTGYFVWNKSAALLYSKRRIRAWKKVKKQNQQNAVEEDNAGYNLDRDMEE